MFYWGPRTSSQLCMWCPAWHILGCGFKVTHWESALTILISSLLMELETSFIAQNDRKGWISGYGSWFQVAISLPYRVIGHIPFLRCACLTKMVNLDKIRKYGIFGIKIHVFWHEKTIASNHFMLKVPQTPLLTHMWIYWSILHGEFVRFWDADRPRDTKIYLARHFTAATILASPLTFPCRYSLPSLRILVG